MKNFKGKQEALLALEEESKETESLQVPSVLSELAEEPLDTQTYFKLKTSVANTIFRVFQFYDIYYIDQTDSPMSVQQFVAKQFEKKTGVLKQAIIKAREDYNTLLRNQPEKSKHKYLVMGFWYGIRVGRFDLIDAQGSGGFPKEEDEQLLTEWHIDSEQFGKAWRLCLLQKGQKVRKESLPHAAIAKDYKTFNLFKARQWLNNAISEILIPHSSEGQAEEVSDEMSALDEELLKIKQKRQKK